MNALLNRLKAYALIELELAQRAPHDEEDAAMFDGPSDDLFAWVDDLESRVGLDVADFRASVIDFALVRDGDPEAADVLARVNRAERWHHFCTREAADRAAVILEAHGVACDVHDYPPGAADVHEITTFHTQAHFRRS